VFSNFKQCLLWGLLVLFLSKTSNIKHVKHMLICTVHMNTEQGRNYRGVGVTPPSLLGWSRRVYHIYPYNFVEQILKKTWFIFNEKWAKWQIDCENTTIPLFYSLCSWIVLKSEHLWVSMKTSTRLETG
jgi:hypothetical protein